MKRILFALLAGTSGLLLNSGSAQTEAEKAPTCTAAKRAAAATVDGKLGKDEYPSAVLTMKQTAERDAIQGAPAVARVFHDGKTLYVTITVPFDDETMLTKGEQWGFDDGAEICVRDASATAPGPTFVIHGFTTGKHECTTAGGAPEDAIRKLEKAIKFAATVDKKSWTGEWAIPFEAMSLKYKPGIKLGFNLGAWRTENREWIIWRGAQGPTHQLDDGGSLILE
jgi:hypothetical protein